MNWAPRIVGLILLGFAGAACGQIKVNPQLLIPLHKKNPVPVPLHMPVPLHQITPEQSPPPPPAEAAPAEAQPAVPDAGGTLIGTPLPPPPDAPQAGATPTKENTAIEPAEVAVMSVSLQDAQQVQQQAQALGMSVMRRAVLHHLGLVISVLRVPEGTSVADALAQLRQAMPRTWFDANRRYPLAAAPARRAEPARLPAQTQRCAQRAGIGMIDTRIKLGDSAFKSARVTTRSFLPAGVAPAGTEHGTTVAAQLRGQGEMPRARHYAAAVYRSRSGGADTDAELVARALDWLVGRKVAAIELSVGGRPDQILQAALLRVEKLGVAVIDARLRSSTHEVQPSKEICP